jgi:hypothetical protein
VTHGSSYVLTVLRDAKHSPGKTYNTADDPKHFEFANLMHELRLIQLKLDSTGRGARIVKLICIEDLGDKLLALLEKDQDQNDDQDEHQDEDEAQGEDQT